MQKLNVGENRQGDVSANLVELLRYEVARFEDSDELPSEFAIRVGRKISNINNSENAS
jgi:hypothetical protein